MSSKDPRGEGVRSWFMLHSGQPTGGAPSATPASSPPARRQRSIPFSLSAEIQRRLPSAAYTCEAGSFTLATWLEPAATVGGDTFDYSLRRDHLHLSVTDAVGHGVASALTATLCVRSLRNSRRLGETLLEQAATTNTALLENVSGVVEGEGLTTALLGRVDLRTGNLYLVNAGDAAPYLARDGQVDALELPADLPLGLFAGSTYRSTTVPLIGDRLVAITDGMLERAAASLDLAAQIQQIRQLHPREATRALADLALKASGGMLAGRRRAAAARLARRSRSASR